MDGPTSTVDLFSDEVLADPYPHYEALRKKGRAVYLTQHRVFAVTGHKDVHAVLTDAETYSSVDGVALTAIANKRILGGTVLAADGAEHARLRRPLSKQLNPRAMRRLTAPRADTGLNVEEHARRLVDDYVERGEFDAADLAQQMVADVVMHLMGLPDSTRQEVIDGARSTFDLFGPANLRYQQSGPAAEAMITFLRKKVSRKTVRPGSWLDALYQAADAGDITDDDVVPLASAYTTAGMDTTIYAISTAIHLLSTHPVQWAHLWDGRTTAETVYRETIRLDAPIQGFGRRVTTPTDIGDTRLAADDQVWVLYGAAGRDPEKWSDPGRFDVRRPGLTDHLALGAGPHHCAGSHLARLQASALLAALASACTHIEPADEPVRALNNTLRGYAHVPVRVAPASRRTFARKDEQQ